MQHSLIVFKSKKVLQLYDQDANIAQYPIGIGKNPIGTKRLEGDCKTPEGDYYICVKNPNSKFYLSLGISYPNVDDAWYGYKAGRIDLPTYESICEAHKFGKIPPWYTPLGGEVYIHGELEYRNYSEGCIRMYNRDIEELFNQLEVGVKLTILP